jgi:hypothetical protein
MSSDYNSCYTGILKYVALYLKQAVPEEKLKLLTSKKLALLHSKEWLVHLLSTGEVRGSILDFGADYDRDQ